METDREMIEMVRKVFGPNGQFQTLRQQVEALAATKNDTADAIKKVLGSGNTALAGWDGASETSMIRLHGKATRTIGGDVVDKTFGDWLKWNAAGCLSGVSAVPVISRDHGQIDKAMNSFDKKYRGSVQKAPNAEGSGATGGYLVPPQFYAKLLQILAEKSFVKTLCTTMPMNGREFWFPYLNQSSVAASTATNFPASNFFGGTFMSWEPEGSVYPQTNPGFKLGKLVARDLVAISVCSNQLLQDSAIALDSLFTTLFTEALSWQLDYAFLRGSGVNQPLGILNAPSTIVQSRGTGSTFVLTDAANMYRDMVASSWDTCCWIMNQSVLPQLITMTNGATNAPFLTWLNPAGGDTETGPAARRLPTTFFGLPIYWTEKTPRLGTTGDVMLVDLSKYLCGDRMAIQVEASQFPFFTSNQMVWRVIWRGDGQPQLDAPLTLADQSGITLVSPHVVLSA